MKRARELVNRQAEDDGLWFVARTAPEAYLQKALRELHAAVESEDNAAESVDTDSLRIAPFLRDITLRLWWKENFWRFRGFNWDDVLSHANYCNDLHELAARMKRIQDETR